MCVHELIRDTLWSDKNKKGMLVLKMENCCCIASSCVIRIKIGERHSLFANLYMSQVLSRRVP